MKYFSALAIVYALTASGAFAASPPAAPVISSDGALYQQFGGHDGVTRIVDDLFVNVDADTRLTGIFDPAKRVHTKAMLVEQFCQILGGGYTYSGKSMAEAHKDLGIQAADFNALVEDLQKAMDTNKVPFSAQNKLLAALAPQHRDIVTGSAKPAQ
jgi:hemoglobin